MTKEQRSITSAFVISVLVGGAYLVSWLAHVWGGQPWPIGSNMVNYAVVLVLFGVSLLLFGNLFARILPQERGFVRACDARLQGRGAAAALVVSALVTAAYLIYYANIGVSKEFAGPSYSPSSLMAPQMVPLYYLLTVLFFVAAIYLLLTGKDCPQWMAWGGYGSDDLPAPQAVLMKMIVEGVMGGNLPWNLVFVGVFIALVVEVLGIPVLPFAIGLYLPIYLSVPMMLGGLLRWYLEKRKYASEKEKDNVVQSGVLYSSGLIAGEGIVGILLAVLAVIPMGLNAEGKTLYLSDKINFSEIFNIGNIGGLICFAVILFTIYLFATKDSKKK